LAETIFHIDISKPLVILLAVLTFFPLKSVRYKLAIASFNSDKKVRSQFVQF